MYEFNLTLPGPFAAVLDAVRQALMTEQLGIVSEIDAQAVLKAKLNKDIPPYRILGACNPKLAERLLGVEPNVGTLLPCNIVVREQAPGQVVVSFMDPVAVLALVDAAEAKAVGAEARARLERVAAALAAGGQGVQA